MKKQFLEITSHVFVPYSECELSYVRSSGPGGQNVNKVNSKAVLRWSLNNSPSLSEEMRYRIRIKLAAKLNLEGELVLSCDSSRDQTQNREECLTKLEKMLADAAVVPKRRKKTKPSYTSQQKAKASKRMHSDKKKFRQGDY